MASVTLGLNCKIYHNTGNYASPVWVEDSNVRDVTLGIDIEEADASIRGGGGHKWSEPTLIGDSIEFEKNDDPTDTFLTALIDAALARTAIEFLVLNGPVLTTGSRGLRATMKVFKCSQKQGLKDISTWEISLKPCVAANPPAKYVA